MFRAIICGFQNVKMETFLKSVRYREEDGCRRRGKGHKYSRDNLVKRFMILNSLSNLENRGVGTNEQTKLFDSSLMDGIEDYNTLSRLAPATLYPKGIT